MNLFDYQRAALETAVYPRHSAAVTYPALGLFGEGGEVANKIKKTIRGDKPMTDELRLELRAELGDVMWYIASTASDTGLIFDQKPSGVCLGDLPTCVLKLASSIGKVTEEALFYQSYPGGITTSKSAMWMSLCECVLAVEAIAHHLGTTLEQVMADNIAKLAERKKKGTLKGDGDKR